jgi:potassium-transporting ATPase potassium-binding subunit
MTTELIQAIVVLVIVGAVHIPLGDYMSRVYTTGSHWRVERTLYRVCGTDPDTDQRWPQYLRSVLAFSVLSILALYAVLRFQAHLPLSLHHPGVAPALAWNTAVSFTTNTSWQSYAGESTLGHVAQMVGLGTAAFASAAVGLAVGVALIRGIVRQQTDRLGNFWVDVTRSLTRILLPLSLIFAVGFVALGVIQNLHAPQNITTLVGGSQHLTGGPVASWEPIKLLSGDGGGFFNANSAHPFENPTAVSNVVELILMLLLPVSLIRTFGAMVGDRRQGWALLAVATVLFVGALGIISAEQNAHPGTVPAATGAASEGTEVRFGPGGTALFGQVATSTADGAANGSYDSATSLGGSVLMANLMLGEVSPGGAGSGLYGLLILAMLSMFLAGLMTGRTPQYLRKKITAREIKFVSLYLVATPAAVLVGAGIVISRAGGRASLLNHGAHGFSELLYALLSAGNSNGSAFAGLNANTDLYNTALAEVMLAGRYLPMVFVLGVAGSLATQRAGVVTVGTVPSHRPLFVTLTISAAVLVSALTFLPALALGPFAEALH